jgi:hypothetical protein
VPIKCLRQPSLYQCSKICGGKWDLISDFGKLKNKSVKFKKIWLKRTGDDGGTVKTENTEMRPVSAINRPVSVINRPVLSINQPVLPINRCGEFRTVFVRNRPIFAEIR